MRGDGLYTDAEIRKLAPFDIERCTGSGISAISDPVLAVVPAGATRPRKEVFAALGLDEARVRDFRSAGINMVEFLTWQVSPSYDLSCMTSVHGDDRRVAALTDPSRAVYGVRLHKRPE